MHHHHHHHRESWEYFSNVPWCKRVLEDDAANSIPIVIGTRFPKPTTTQYSFFGKTLNSADTIKHCVAIKKLKATTQEEAEGGNEIIMLLELGDGLNGHAHVCHGGFVCVLLDEVMGLVNWHHKDPHVHVMTANINVSFKKPVMTPSIVKCSAWITKSEGRKRFTFGKLEDEHEVVHASAEGLFLEIKGILFYLDKRKKEKKN